ncbi:MAG TPA: DUF1153 domain-containing protein [Roseovarius sp.]|nr:DUF1153 domain-containing protein [Roseovarius sp.]
MFLKKLDGPRAVTLPDGRVMSRADLPPRDTTRWTVARKRAVVRGVVHGLLTRAEAQERYELSEEEFQEWLNALSRHGAEGLKATVRHRQDGQP